MTEDSWGSCGTGNCPKCHKNTLIITTGGSQRTGSFKDEHCLNCDYIAYEYTNPEPEIARLSQ